MITFITMLAFYAVILLLLVSITASVIAFIKSSKLRDKTLWITNATVILLVKLAVITDFFLLFSNQLVSVTSHDLISNISLFASLISAIAFIALVIGGQCINKVMR